MPRLDRAPFALIILDGWGWREDTDHNATRNSNPRHLDELAARYPWLLIDCSGPSVGLPEGYIGNSEVGHQCMGSGRIASQGLSQIFQAIESGDFSRNAILRRAFQDAVRGGRAVHLVGLVSDGGVHSHVEHAVALVRLGREMGCKRLYVHAFTDGRDTPPDSGLGYVTGLETALSKVGLGRVASISGRYYAMDRDQRWDRIEKAYAALVRGVGHRAESGAAAVQQAYERGESDEFIEPTLVEEAGEPVATIEAGDSVIFFNFRADRARQMTRALTEPDFDSFQRPEGALPGTMVCFMKYDDSFELPVAFPKVTPTEVLGELLAASGIRQVRCAETEKYAHVTLFFNGGREQPFDGEDRILVPSPKVATYDLQPEMSAPEVAERAVGALQTDQPMVLVLNFANADMVGHTGDYRAALAACRAVDESVGRVVRALFERGGHAIIAADHGNAETMVNPSTGEPHTAHTLNPVRAILAGETFRDRAVRDRGTLADFSPTLLEVLDIPQPSAMTGRSLLR
jgi:2,3-bisphosphoglycerate-independent phosphoglycerate mutase